MTDARPDSFFVEAGDAALWSIASGLVDAPSIVAVGGWTGSSELWIGPLAVLANGRRCVTYDHRGTGVTIAEPESITHRRLVDDVFAVMDAHGLGRATLVAESAGAAVVLSAAAARPERVEDLVLVDALVPSDRPGDDDPFVQALRADYAATAAAFVDACAPDPAHDRIRHWGRRILARSSAEPAIALLRADVPDPPLDLATIAVPTLLIHCVGDAISPVEGARELAAALPHATLTVLDGAEHVPTMTRPAEIAALIEGWLAARQ